jgi:hypothetical protein
MVARKQNYVQPLGRRVREIGLCGSGRFIECNASHRTNELGIAYLDRPILHHNGSSLERGATFASASMVIRRTVPVVGSSESVP